MRSNLFDKIVLIIYAQIHVRAQNYIQFNLGLGRTHTLYVLQIPPHLLTPHSLQSLCCTPLYRACTLLRILFCDPRWPVFQVVFSATCSAQCAQSLRARPLILSFVQPDCWKLSLVVPE